MSLGGLGVQGYHPPNGTLPDRHHEGGVGNEQLH